jgi:hypothetical protein
LASDHSRRAPARQQTSAIAAIHGEENKTAISRAVTNSGTPAVCACSGDWRNHVARACCPPADSLEFALREHSRTLAQAADDLTASLRPDSFAKVAFAASVVERDAYTLQVAAGQLSLSRHHEATGAASRDLDAVSARSDKEDQGVVDVA